MIPRYQLQNPEKVFSPGLLFYPGIIQRNIDRLVDITGDPDRLRPHVKTHKTREIARMQMRAGIRKFKCATIAEAEMLGECGAPDVLIAYQLVGPNIERYVKLMRRFPDTKYSSLVDNETSARQLSAALQREGMAADAFLDLDVGMHRTGIPMGEAAVRLCEVVDKLPSVNLAGLHGYDGHNHQTDLAERQAAAQQVLDQVFKLKEAVEKKGMSVPSIVVGGTPLLGIYCQTPGVEASPGTYVLHDWGYKTVVPDLDFEWAALVFGRVISCTTPGSVTIDVGYKSIASDPPEDRGLILNIDDARLGRQNEEHWVIDTNHAADLKVGDEVYVAPRHICPTVALHAFANVIDETGRCVDQWEIRARPRVISI